MRRTTFAGLAGLMLNLSAGCLPQQTTTRSQAADDLGDAEQLATVGSKTEVGNIEPIPVSGVGYVHNLAGTGSIPTADGWRSSLETALRRQKFNPRELLDDKSLKQSLVVVTAEIPPGARAGDPIDVAISLPAGSKTTSLRGGTLFPADLANAELAATAREAMQSQGIAVGKTPAATDSTVLTGHRMGRAEGTLVAGFDTVGKGEAGDGPRAARIWGGGKVLVDRPYYFLLRDNTPQSRLALVVAERLNAVFHAAGDVGGKLAEAKVANQPMVVCMVPPAYRLNHTRFLTVAHHVPLSPVTADTPYRKQLENDLLRPETAIVAAVKLEALGGDSKVPLRVGLESESPWVRFASAEALAYLGFSDGAKDLADLAAKHPSVRTQCLTALASLDDAVCLDQLVELMRHSDPQLRYGAFVALRHADPNHDAVRGKRHNQSFWLHNVAPDADPMVHVASDRRAEVVLFGSRFPLRTPFSFALGKEYTVSAKDGEPTVTVSRVTTGKDGEPTTVAKTCLTDIGMVLKTLADMGATYPEAVEFVRRAQKAEVVTTAVLFDAAPRGMNIQQLAAISRTDPLAEKADLEVTRVGTADVVQTSFHLPGEGEAVQAKPAPAPAPDLAREPGRIFGPKRPADPAPAADGEKK